MRFFGLFWAKMTKIGIQNPKLIVTNDYQKFWAHFDWFLSLFQISDVKPELSPVELKVSKNGIFWAKNLFQKNFPRLFLSPNQSWARRQQKCYRNPFLGQFETPKEYGRHCHRYLEKVKFFRVIWITKR